VETLFSVFRIAFCGEDKLGIIANKQVVQPIFLQVRTWQFDQ